jgi:hypothetical protein
MRPWHYVVTGVVCVLSSAACASVDPPHVRAAASPQVAVPAVAPAPTDEGAAPALEPPPYPVAAARTVSEHVNLREQVTLEIVDGRAVTTFAVRQREARIVSLAPRTLAVEASTPFTLAAHEPYEPAPYLVPRQPRVRLRDGSTFTVWTCGSGHVWGQLLDRRGAPRDHGYVLTDPATLVIGAPYVASADGEHVVLLYFSGGEEGSSLVATELGLSATLPRGEPVAAAR